MRGEIFRGRQHKLIFLAIEDKGLMVSEIMKKVNKNLSNTEKTLTLRETSRALKWLEERKYVECLNPKDRKERGKTGIMYKISIKGKEIKKIL